MHFDKIQKLTFGELRRATSRFKTVFLTLFHSRVTGQESSLLEGGTEFCIVLKQSAGQAMADCAGLAGDAAALDGADDVEFTLGLSQCEGLTDDEFQRIQAEILFDVTAVDGNACLLYTSRCV